MDVIHVDFSGRHKRPSRADDDDSFLETVVDTYLEFHPGVDREAARQLFKQGLAFQASLLESEAL